MSLEQILPQYPDAIAHRRFDDGMYAIAYPLLLHWTIIHGHEDDLSGYDQRWCYATGELAEMALNEWDYPAQKEPEGWHRHPLTGRRRPGGDKTQEYIAW